jgi:cyclopropane fatty-acyl-phospholipid synthase-like methyltransferase
MFRATGGTVLPPRLQLPLDLADIRAGMRVVDIGCGRGEIVLHCAQQGALCWGLDYAAAAVQLAHENLERVAPAAVQSHLAIQRSDAQRLPFGSGTIDRVFMLDVVEHLTPPELSAALDDVWRILRPGGRLVVHTMPNLWYYHYGYPLYRALQSLRGHRLPANPRERWALHHVHVNEQDPRRLGQTLSAHRFKTRVSLRNVHTYEYESNRFVRLGMTLLTRVIPFRWVFCDDIFAIGVKP